MKAVEIDTIRSRNGNGNGKSSPNDSTKSTTSEPIDILGNGKARQSVNRAKVYPALRSIAAEYHSTMYEQGYNLAINSRVLEARQEDLEAIKEFAAKAARECKRDDFDISLRRHDQMHNAEHDKHLADRRFAEEAKKFAYAEMRERAKEAKQAKAHKRSAVDYVLSHEDRIIRYSVFPTDIACHAISKALPKNASAEKLTEEFEALDHSVPVEVFPQQPADHLCFRGILHNNEFRFEAGIGQAMYTFEQERGLHPIVTGYLELSTRQPKVIKQPTGEPKIKIIEDNLYFLLDLYGESLLMKCLDLSNSLGVNWLAIEGYYNYFNQSPPFVCDIDLPQDIAFHCS